MFVAPVGRNRLRASSVPRLLIALLAGAFSGAAWAHGGATIDKDPCIQKTGERIVHFTVYQPDINPAGEYCADVPKAGPMIVVFDLVDPELRKVPLDVQVVKQSGSTREVAFHLPPTTYPKGVINAEIRLDAPGRYVAMLAPEGSAAVSFPMRVEMGWSILVWIPPLLLAAPLLYYWSRRRTPPSAAQPDARRNLALVK